MLPTELQKALEEFLPIHNVIQLDLFQLFLMPAYTKINAPFLLKTQNSVTLVSEPIKHWLSPSNVEPNTN